MTYPSSFHLFSRDCRDEQISPYVLSRGPFPSSLILDPLLTWSEIYLTYTERKNQNHATGLKPDFPKMKSITLWEQGGKGPPYPPIDPEKYSVKSYSTRPIDKRVFLTQHNKLSPTSRQVRFSARLGSHNH